MNEISILKKTELLGNNFMVYGTLEEPLFKAKDVTDMLGLTNPREVMSRVDEDERCKLNLPRQGATWMLTENGLYEVLLQSRKPIAKEFKKGVKAILKEIRKTGGYMVAKKDDTPEEIMARALLLAQATIDRQKAQVVEAERKFAQLDTMNKGLSKQVEGLERSNRFLRPGATFAKAVETSEHSILVGELARIIKQNGVEIGQNRLFAWLRDNGYLCKKGEMYNQPTQKALGMGLFEIKKTVIQKPNGDSLVTTTTKVTGKGQIYFVNKFLFTTIGTEEAAAIGTTGSTSIEKGGKA